MPQQIHTVTDATFEGDIGRRSGIVLVDFWAPWCGPSTALSPLLDELADDYDSQARIARVNADDNKEISEKLSVRGWPTLILFKDDVEKERVLGLQRKKRLADLLDKHLEA